MKIILAVLLSCQLATAAHKPFRVVVAPRPLPEVEMGEWYITTREGATGVIEITPCMWCEVYANARLNVMGEAWSGGAHYDYGTGECHIMLTSDSRHEKFGNTKTVVIGVDILLGKRR